MLHFPALYWIAGWMGEYEEGPIWCDCSCFFRPQLQVLISTSSESFLSVDSSQRNHITMGEPSAPGPNLTLGPLLWSRSTLSEDQALIVVNLVHSEFTMLILTFLIKWEAMWRGIEKERTGNGLLSMHEVDEVAVSGKWCEHRDGNWLVLYYLVLV